MQIIYIITSYFSICYFFMHCGLRQSVDYFQQICLKISFFCTGLDRPRCASFEGRSYDHLYL
jgi:hypothetical protein